LGLSSVATFDELLVEHRRAVREVFATLGIAPAPTGVDFAAVPFADQPTARAELELLASRPGSPFAPGAIGEAAAVASALVAELASCPDPDQALRHLVDLVCRGGAVAGVWTLLSGSRALLTLLVSLFGTSEFLARRFVQHPALLDVLVSVGGAPARRQATELEADLSERLAAARGDYEDELRALRRFKQEEELRIGLHDLAGALELDDLFGQLSSLAEVLLRSALGLVVPGPAAPMAIVALGKLGAGELDFGSDLDLVFVHGGDAIADHERTARVAQRLIRALGAYMENGRLYEIDTRLRPSGRQGLLVTTLDGLRHYHEREAQLWERQALIKARVVAGEPALAQAVEAMRVEIVYDRPLPPDAAAQIARTRARMEHELTNAEPGTYDVKLGPGGLVDVEFVTQYLQLVHGGAHEDVRARATREALAALHAAGALDADDHRVLVDAYRFLRHLESRLRIVHDRPSAELRAQPASELDKLARRLGYRDPQGVAGPRLFEHHLTTTRAVRHIYERILGLPP
jgi:glutamate-ammonia-ligase adenylyltransferase